MTGRPKRDTSPMASRIFVPHELVREAQTLRLRMESSSTTMALSSEPPRARPSFLQLLHVAQEPKARGGEILRENSLSPVRRQPRPRPGCIGCSKSMVQLMRKFVEGVSEACLSPSTTDTDLRMTSSLGVSSSRMPLPG